MSTDFEAYVLLGVSVKRAKSMNLELSLSHDCFEIRFRPNRGAAIRCEIPPSAAALEAFLDGMEFSEDLGKLE